MADADSQSTRAMLALDDLRIIELPCFDQMPYFAAAAFAASNVGRRLMHKEAGDLFQRLYAGILGRSGAANTPTRCSAACSVIQVRKSITFASRGYWASRSDSTLMISASDLVFVF